MLQTQAANDLGLPQAGPGSLPATSAVTVAAGATFSLDDVSQAVASLSGAGSVNLGSATLTVGGNNSSTAFSGVISDSGNVTKIGTGTWTVTGSQLFTGVMTVSAGTVQLGDGATADGSLVANIVDDSALVLADPDNLALLGAISGGGSLDKLCDNTVTLAMANSFTGGSQILAGSVVFSGGTPLGTGTVDLAGGTLQFAPAAGFSASYYNVANDGNVPDLSGLTPVATRIDATIDFPNDGNGFEPGIAGLNTTNCAAVWTGVLDVTIGGTYTFQSTSDDGSLLFVDGQEVVNDNGGHPMQTATGTIDLAPGQHTVTIEYTQAGGGAGIIVQYSGADTGGVMVDLGSLAGSVTAGAALNLTNPLTVTADSSIQLPASGTVGLASLAIGGQTFNITGTTAATTLAVSGGVTLAGPGSATFNVGTNVTLDLEGVVSGPGGMIKTGPGGMNMTAANTFSGPISLLDGTTQALAAAGTGGTSSLPGDVSLDNAILRLSPSFGTSVVAGFLGSYYNVTNSGYVPDFSDLTPVATRVDSTVDFPNDGNGFEPGIAGLDTTNSGAVWTGLLDVTSGGAYTFQMTSDDGSLLYVDGTQVVNDDGPHGMQTATGTIDLAPGEHAVTIDYVQAGGGAGVIAQYAGADTGGAMVDIGSLDGSVVNIAGGMAALVMNLSSNFSVGGASTIDLDCSATSTGALTAADGSQLTLTTDATTGYGLQQATFTQTGAVTLAGTFTLDTATASAAISGPIGESTPVAGSLITTGPDSLLLTGDNSYTATAITGGTVQVGDGGTSGTLGTGPVIDNGGARVQPHRHAHGAQRHQRHRLRDPIGHGQRGPHRRQQLWPDDHRRRHSPSRRRWNLGHTRHRPGH